MSLCNACGSAIQEVNQNAPRVCNKLDGMPCLVCSQVDDLEEKVRQTQATMNQLLGQIRALKEKRNQEHDPFIHRLPPEVASYIFVLALPRPAYSNVFYDIDQDSRDEDYDQPFPFIIGAICRRWREIAWKTPELWTILSINLDPTITSPLSSGELVADWLTRTGQLHLYIRLFFIHPPFGSVPAPHISGPLVEVLKRFIHRCVVLDLHLPVELLARFNGCAHCPAMDTLRLFPHRAGYDRLAVGFNLAALSPHLRRLSTDRLSLNGLDVHWNHLTHFVGSFLLRSECLMLLKEATNMIDCHLSFVSSDGDIPVPSSTHIIHRCLQSFRLAEPTSSPLWNHLTTPSLIILATCMWNFESLIDLIAFIRRSACTLTQLQIEQVLIENADIFLEMLQHMPSLEQLTLTNVTITDIFLQHFGRTAKFDGFEQDERFLPHLEDLRLRGHRIFDWHNLPSVLPDLPFQKDGHRPLSKISIELFIHDWEYDSKPEDVEEDVIDPQALELIQEVLDSGFILRIKDIEERDMVIRARSLHGLSKMVGGK